jgi:hypothetical protein
VSGIVILGMCVYLCRCIFRSVVVAVCVELCMCVRMGMFI